MTLSLHVRRRRRVWTVDRGHSWQVQCFGSDTVNPASISISLLSSLGAFNDSMQGNTADWYSRFRTITIRRHECNQVQSCAIICNQVQRVGQGVSRLASMNHDGPVLTYTLTTPKVCTLRDGPTSFSCRGRSRTHPKGQGSKALIDMTKRLLPLRQLDSTAAFCWQEI